MNFKKFVITKETEITDIVHFLESAGEEPVLLTFTGESEILVSPVNIRFIQKTATANKVPLIFQIIQNKTGLSNAREVGVVTYTKTDPIPEDVWQKAKEYMIQQYDLRKAKLRHETEAMKKIKSESEMTQNAELSTEDAQFAKSTELEEAVDVNPSAKATIPSHKAFQDKIDQAIQKAKAMTHRTGTDSADGPKVIREGSVEIALASSAGDERSLLDMDFSGGRRDDQSGSETEGKSAVPSEKAHFHIKHEFSLKKSLPFLNKLTKANLMKLTVIMLILLGLGAYLFYLYVPRVEAVLHVAGQRIDIEETFTGDTSVQTFDSVKKKIRVKEETIEQSRSGTAATTAIGTKGSKAQGSVRVYQDGDEPITVPAGTIVVATEGGYKFKTMNTYVVQPGETETVAVEAVDIGSEYNVPAGTHFTFEGFPQFNSAKTFVSFAGGDKTEFKAVAQADIDELGKELQKSAFEQADKELREKAKDGWVLIEETVKHALDGDITSDKNVGDEADVVNVDVKTKSTALYYNEADLLDHRQEMIAEYMEKLGAKNADGFTWDLSEGVETDIQLKEVKDGVVKVVLKITGDLKPRVDINVLKERLAGKSWQEGLEYLKSLTFVTRESDVDFTPEWFPEWLRYFPKDKKRIKISVEIEKVNAPDGAEENETAKDGSQSS